MLPQQNIRYRWISLWLLFGTILGFIPVFLFSNRDNLSLSLLLLWALAYLVLGGLLGFIFSVPKLISENNFTSAGSAATSEASLRTRYQENTNLTQVSDWLTKVLIGAGLVQLKEIPKFIIHVSTIMSQGIQFQKINPVPANSSIVICAAIVIFFITWGFICGYLTMKLVLTQQFAESQQQLPEPLSPNN